MIMKAYISNIVMKVLDETLGKKYPIVDEITDVFQEQEKRFKKIERKIAKIEKQLKAKK